MPNPLVMLNIQHSGLVCSTGASMVPIWGEYHATDERDVVSLGKAAQCGKLRLWWRTLPSCRSLGSTVAPYRAHQVRTVKYVITHTHSRPHWSELKLVYFVHFKYPTTFQPPPERKSSNNPHSQTLDNIFLKFGTKQSAITYWTCRWSRFRFSAKCTEVKMPVQS